jgi:hypothetical protein
MLAEAWREKKYLLSFGRALLWVGAVMTLGPSRPTAEAPGNDEAIWNAGLAGEKALEDHLAKSLGDEWVLISGFKGRNGEVDEILVGPSGMFAIEIKNVNGVVSCNGDTWSLDKYDRYGNLVESDKPIADKTGRGPSRQLNESTQPLRENLRQVQHIYTIVMLTHERARLGDIRDATVDEVSVLSDWSIDSTLQRSKATLSTSDVDAIARRIVSIQNRKEGTRRSDRKTERNGSSGSGKATSESA